MMELQNNSKQLVYSKFTTNDGDKLQKSSVRNRKKKKRNKKE